MSGVSQRHRFRLLYFMNELKKSDQLWRFVGLGFGFAAVIGVLYGLSIESKKEGGPLGTISQLQNACKKDIRRYDRDWNFNRGIRFIGGSKEFKETGNGKVWAAKTNKWKVEEEQNFICEDGRAISVP